MIHEFTHHRGPDERKGFRAIEAGGELRRKMLLPRADDMATEGDARRFRARKVFSALFFRWW